MMNNVIEIEEMSHQISKCSCREYFNPLCCSSNVRPVCLPWQENDPGRDLKENKKAVVTGWGRVKTSLKDIERKQKFGASARNLLYVRLPIANQVCEDDPDLEQYWDPETKICAGGKQGKYNFFGSIGLLFVRQPL